LLIVDDNQSFLEAARVLLEREGLTVAGVALTSAEALREAETLRPDIVLVDISLGEESGFDHLRPRCSQPSRRRSFRSCTSRMRRSVALTPRGR
jgi:DNA-binding response OmpR family regulator